MPSNHYTDDDDGHGTHVAGIATGKTYGWAKNANIYAMNILMIMELILRHYITEDFLNHVVHQQTM